MRSVIFIKGFKVGSGTLIHHFKSKQVAGSMFDDCVSTEDHIKHIKVITLRNKRISPGEIILFLYK